MPVADPAAQRPQRAVASDERGRGGVGAFDHPDVTEVGELPGPALDISDEGLQRVGQFVSDAVVEEGGNSARSRPESIAVSRLLADTVHTWSADCFA